jgi:low temperature requirement protein LtrA
VLDGDVPRGDRLRRPVDPGATATERAGHDALQRVRYGLSTWFRTPPRRHGEVVATREVSFLELFYDLVYVVLIGRTAHHLALHVTGRGVVEFAVVFGMIWLAWFNGTFWHELHGREDGRSRNYIFLQMGLLAVLAVFAEHAAAGDGEEFAATYTALFVLLTWQWWQVHRIDTDPRYRPTTIRYLAGMVASTGAVGASAFVSDGWRIGIWAAVVVCWVVGGHLLVGVDHTEGFGEGVTASLVERMGLFTIVVLGEVVVGVVGGIGDIEARSATTMVTGVVGLTIGMGLWWNYFDLLGRRVPGRRGRRLANWLYAHLPLAMAIAAGGAAMISIVGHAEDSTTPRAAAWLLTGSVAIALGAIGIATTGMPDDELPRGMRRWFAPSFAVAALALLAIGALHPAPIVLVAGVSVVLLLTWLALFVVFLALGGDPEVVEFQLGHDGPHGSQAMHGHPGAGTPTSRHGEPAE